MPRPIAVAEFATFVEKQGWDPNHYFLPGRALCLDGPDISIFLTVLGFYLLGDALRERIAERRAS